MMAQKKKVGIITFHASHNYGSMLQAYALQQIIFGMGYDCEIINFRTKRQREFYRPTFVRGSFIGRIKRSIFYAPYISSWKKKHQLFELFLEEKYHLSAKEYSTLEELERATLNYDIYISGSDQIWNTCAFDFDWAYFLPFAGHARRVAYAPSMGPSPLQSINSVEKAEKIAKLMHYYDFISVRELQTREKIMQFTDIECAVTLDPTLLIGAEIWNKMAGDTPLIKGNYIFLYTPWFNEAIYTEAERMSKAMNMPIVVSLLHNGWRNNRRITRKPYLCHLATGPIEFLNLCKFATFNIGKSFHLVVFSILLRTPFYAMNGMKDSRVRDLLVQTGLEALGRSLPENAVLPVIDFDEAHRRIAKASRLSLEWLHNSLQ